MFRKVCVALVPKRTLCSLPPKGVFVDRQLTKSRHLVAIQKQPLTNFQSANRFIFTTSNFKESKDITSKNEENERLDKLRHEELLSARKFQSDESFSAESMQKIDVETASLLYEGDVAQNKTFSQADTKAGSSYSNTNVKLPLSIYHYHF
jgi:hypothetical protein